MKKFLAIDYAEVETQLVAAIRVVFGRLPPIMRRIAGETFRQRALLLAATRAGPR
jgi:hypothetical protein